MTIPSGSVVGRSLSECTTKSTSPDSRLFSSSCKRIRTWKKVKSKSKPINNLFFVRLTNLRKETLLADLGEGDIKDSVSRCHFLNDVELTIRKLPFQFGHYVVGLDHSQLHKLWKERSKLILSSKLITKFRVWCLLSKFNEAYLTLPCAHFENLLRFVVLGHNAYSPWRDLCIYKLTVSLDWRRAHADSWKILIT